MLAETDNLVVEHLRHIRGKVDRSDEKLTLVELRLSAMESHMAGLMRSDLGQNVDLDQLNRRVSRIERRLELTGD